MDATEESEGVAAIIYLQARHNQVETEEQAKEGWMAMSEKEKETTMDLYLACIMGDLVDMAQLVPVAKLRHLVAKGEAGAGKIKEVLPSGKSFDQHTIKARLLLDFIDDLNDHDAKVERGEI